MDDLSAWLTQVWDADEARLSAPTFCGPVWPTTVQMLARIAADRQILADYRKVLRQQEENSDEFALLMRQPGEDYERLNQVKTFGWQVQGRVEALSAVVRLLASPHADRPGYQSEWRP